MATRKIKIGTIQVRVTRRVTVRTAVTSRAVVQPVAVRASTPAPRPAPQLAARPSRPSYSTSERQFLDHVRDVVDADGTPRPRDVFLCHAWDDRAAAALELFEALTRLQVDVWFSERDVVLGKGLARQLDAGLRVSRVGVVLVTPAMLSALRAGGFADQELGALLGTDRVIPVVHNVGYGELRAESPLLASRAGLSTDGSSLGDVAAMIAQSVLGIERSDR